MAKKIEYQIGFKTDKSGLTELQGLLDQITVSAKVPGAEMDASLQNAARTANKISSILDKTFNQNLGTLNVTKFNQELSKSNITAQQLKTSLTNAGESGIRAYSILGSSILSTNMRIKESSQMLDKMATTFANTVRYGISSSIFNTFSNSIQRAYDFSVKLNTSLNDIRIVTNKSAQDMDLFAEKANKAAKLLGSNTLDYANASLIYFQQGLSDAETEARAETTIKAANVTGQTGADVSEQLTAVWNGYKVTAEETELYVDKLAAVAASTAADLKELSTGMSKVASAASTAGVDIDQLNGILATVISVTREAPETIGSSFKTIFARLGDLKLGGEDDEGIGLGTVSGQLKQLGIDLLDQTGNMRDMGDVIEDVAAKWQTWTKAQKQAAAVAMAGKMQYSRLIALFENWNMYSDALETSQNAMGTLQEQQDIYMESTSAHLKTLKSTWEDLYNGLINNNEVNTGVDALTNAVQVMDNFVDSFGGGLNSLTAFGTIVANIFNKQIGTAISKAINNTNTLKQNIANLESKRDFVKAGIVEEGPKALESQGKVVNYNTQLEYSKQILDVQRNISNEQYNQLTNIQQQIAALEEKVYVEQKDIELKVQSAFGTKAVGDPEAVIAQASEELQYRSAIQEAISKTNIALKERENLGVSIGDLQRNLLAAYEKEGKVKNKTIKTALQELQVLKYKRNTEKETEDYQKRVRATLRKITLEEEKSKSVTKSKNELAKEYQKTLKEIDNLSNERDLLKIDFEDNMAQAKQADNIINKVSAITNSLSAVTTLWSSVNMLFQTWTDETASFGDKIVQTFMTAGFALPTLLNSINSLSEALGFQSSIMDVLKAKKEAKIALDAAETKGNISQAASDELSAIAKEKNNDALEKGTLTLGKKSAASGTYIGLTKAETVAVDKATESQEAWNTSILSSPIFPVIVAIGALVAGVAAFIAIQKKADEAARENNDSLIETENKTQSQIDKNKELLDSYTSVYEKYKENTATKEEMSKAAEGLKDVLIDEKQAIKNSAIEVANLTGNYESLIEKVDELNKKQLGEGIQSAKIESGAAEDNLMKTANSGRLLTVGFEKDDPDKKVIEAMVNAGFKENPILADMILPESHTGEEALETYDRLKSVYDRINSEELMTADEKRSSDLYKNVSKWLRDVEKDAEAYRTTLEDIGKYSAELEALNLNFDEATDFSGFQEKRQQLIDFLSTLDTYKDKTSKELSEIANTYIQTATDSADEYIDRINLIDSLTEQAAYKNGNITDFFGTAGEGTDIKEALGTLSTEQLTTLSKISEGQLTTSLAALTSQGKTVAEALIELANVYQTNEEETISVDKATKELLKEYGVSEDAYKRYVKRIQSVNENLANNEDAAQTLAKRNLQLNKGLESLGKGFEKWNSTLTDSDENAKNTIEYWEAMSELGNSLEDIFGVEVSNDFILRHLEQIGKLAKGDISVLEDLQHEAAKDYVANMSIVQTEGSSTEDIRAKLDEMIDYYNNQDLEFGVSFDNQDYINSLNEMLEKGQITADQANAILSSIGFAPTIDQKEVAQTVHHKYSYKLPFTDKTISWEVDDTQKVKVPFINADKTTYTGGAGAANFSNTSAGKDTGGGGGGGSKEPDIMDPLDEEADRYHQIDKQIKIIENDLSMIDKAKEKAFGSDLINLLNNQLSKLNKQIDNYNKKIQIAQGEAEELRNKLSGKGVRYNDDGTIGNYVQAIKAQEDYVNSLINNYNSMSAEAQESYKDTVEQAKKDFEDFKTNIDRYDEVITDLIPGLRENIQDAIDEQIGIQIEEFNMEIDIRLNMKEAEKDWLDFRKKVIDQIKDDNILGNAVASLAQFKSFYEGMAGNLISNNAQHLRDIMAQLDEINAKGNASIYGDNRKQALEDLKNYLDEITNNMEEMEDLADEVRESYLEMMDEANEKFEDQISLYEQISSLIEHDMKVIELVRGEDSYKELAQYYDRQEENYQYQLNFQSQQVQFWKQQIELAEEGSERWLEARKNWQDALDNWNSTIEEAIENIRDKWINAINEIFQKLNDKVTNGLGLDYVSEEWTLINNNADQYLDTINRLYGIQKVQAKYLEGIDQTNSVTAQRKLNELMNQEIKALQERDKLTQYDIERAERKYQIALKQIALEEAQQNKSTMRLRRDSQGNYTYQFVEDQSATGKLRDELNDLYNQLYNFDLSHYKDNLNQILSNWTEYQDKMAEAAQINDPVKRAEREMLIQEQYGQMINGLVEQNEQVRMNLYESGSTELAQLRNEDLENFQKLSDAEKDIMFGEMIPQWESGVQHMAEVFAGEGGFVPVCEDAINDLHDVTEQYEQDLKELEEAGNFSFEAIYNGIDNAIDYTQTLLEDNDELINKYGDELRAVQAVIDELDTLISKYRDAKTEALAATDAAYKYWQLENQKAAEAAQKAQAEAAAKKAAEIAKAKASASAGTPAGGSSGGDGILSVGDTATYSGRYYSDSYGGGASGSAYSGVTRGIIVDRIVGNPYGVHIHSADGRYPDLGWIKKEQLTGYDTGGYTGSWGNSGRLGILHQKELVLNSSDTKNMLDIVSVVRDVMNRVGNSINAGYTNIRTAFGEATQNSGVSQNIVINADFPNVENSKEIENAFDNLLNIASMRANRS